MNINEQEFFSEVTLRICSSLEIEKAMLLCVQYISRFIPLDVIFLNLYERNMGAMRTIASATSCNGKRLDRFTYLSEQARSALEEGKRMFQEQSDLSAALIVNHPENDPICQSMVEDFGIPDTSLLIMPLALEEDTIGNMVFVAQGKDRYTLEHAHLVALLKKPFVIAMSNALKHREVLRLQEILADDNRYLHEELQKLRGDEIIGADFGLKHVFDLARYVAPLGSPVLLQGETGTGKEIIASAIHNASPRCGGPFIRVNCGAIPETLIDSELFGYEKGAFTGALSQKRGRFERAHGGTIFLDEIGELSLNAQVRLLRVFQEKEIERVGGSKSIQVDIRVIAATHRNLEDMIAKGTFREDLYFRIRVFPIRLPPLRERREDIPALVQYFINRKSLEMKLGFAPTLESQELERLITYDWPGNVRELENAVERALILCRGNPLAFDDVKPSPHDSHEAQTQEPGERLTLNQIMERHIRNILEITHGKIEGEEGAAEILGLNPGTLRHRMRLLGIPFGRKHKLMEKYQKEC